MNNLPPAPDQDNPTAVEVPIRTKKSTIRIYAGLSANGMHEAAMALNPRFRA